MTSLTEVKSLEEGFALSESFVLREMNLPCNIDRCVKRATDYSESLFGYGLDGESVDIMATEAFQYFLNGTLKVNIVDAPFPVLDNNELPDILLQAVLKSKMDVCLTLTRKDSFTPFHVDPDHGGGWMYLQTGVKTWHLKKGNEVKITTLFAGDFLYFTPLTPHQVWTFEDSFGIGGYAKID